MPFHEEPYQKAEDFGATGVDLFSDLPERVKDSPDNLQSCQSVTDLERLVCIVWADILTWNIHPAIDTSCTLVLGFGGVSLSLVKAEASYFSFAWDQSPTPHSRIY